MWQKSIETTEVKWLESCGCVPFKVRASISARKVVTVPLCATASTQKTNTLMRNIILCTPCVHACVWVCTCMLTGSITTMPGHMTLLSIMWKTPKAFTNTSTALFKQRYIPAWARMAGVTCDSGPDFLCGKAIDPPIAHTALHSAPPFIPKQTPLCAELWWPPSRGAKILYTSLLSWHILIYV